MTDKELLEAAAKAAGIVLEWDGNPEQWQPMYYEGKTYHSFDPLTDDGDALRLAVKLHIDLYFDNGMVEAIWIDESLSESHSIEVRCNEAFEGMDAKYAAARLAIVRAAAEIGNQ